METKPFKLSAVLSVTTGRLLGDIDDFYKILSFMTGERLMTHQLPRALGPCRSSLLEQFTFLQSSHMSSAEAALGDILRGVEKRCDELATLADASGKDFISREIENSAKKAAISDWLVSLTAGAFEIKFPATFDVAPLGASLYTKKDPIEELIEMRGSDKGIVVVHAPA